MGTRVRHWKQKDKYTEAAPQRMASQVVLPGKEPACQCGRHKRCGLDPWVRKMPWRTAWQPTPVLLSGESHGQRNLVGYSP